MHDTNDTNNNSNVSCPENTIKKRTTNKNDDKSIETIETINIDANIYEPKIRWPDLCAQLFLHVGAIYGLIFQFYAIKFYTLLWCKY